jgi:hypothetical protein
MVVSLPVVGLLAQHSLILPLFTTCITLTVAVFLTCGLREVENNYKAKEKKPFETIITTFKKFPTLLILHAYTPSLSVQFLA